MERKQILEAAAKIRETVNMLPKIGLILGSGLGDFVEEMEGKVTLKYEDIPHVPVSTVQGHKGQFVFGKMNGNDVVSMQGRFHFYEGYSMKEVTFPVRVMKALGVETLIVTNAAGGVNESFSPGDFMLITDHINLSGENPLIGPNDETLGVRFPDLSNAYCKKLQEIAKEEAKKQQIALREGIYVFNTGPSYETPAEVKMIRKLGGDAVGMSTVPEVIVARHAEMNVLGISCISNMAAGILSEPLSHEDVIETTNRAKERFSSLLKAIIGRL